MKTEWWMWTDKTSTDASDARMILAWANRDVRYSAGELRDNPRLSQIEIYAIGVINNACKHVINSAD